jgi:hypothetical protein
MVFLHLSVTYIDTLFCPSVNIYKEDVVDMRFVTVITQFQVTIATNCQLLTHCMNVNSVGHERTSSALLRCIVSIL